MYFAQVLRNKTLNDCLIVRMTIPGDQCCAENIKMRNEETKYNRAKPEEKRH